MYRTFKTYNPETFPILMSKLQKERFYSYIADAKSYFEYGAGGSTQYADSQAHLETITSVESDHDWSLKLSQRFPRVNMVWVDIGPTKEYGWPADDSLRMVWPRYPEVWGLTTYPYDLVLIDGRFRVACCLYICLNPKSVKTILFDDFYDRPKYHCVLPFVDVIERADKMLVCKPKVSFDRDACKALYETYKYDAN